MLRKLLKYDLKNIFKFLLIFYSLAFFFALLTRIFLNIEGSFIINIIGQICSGVTISMIFNILINNLMQLWIKFKNNFYKDEAYLTHTLPVTKKDLYLSKILSAIISLFMSALVIGITLFIAYYSKENILMLQKILLPIADAYDSTIIKILLSFLFIFFLEFANAAQSGYSGIIMGYKMNNAKTGFSILFGFITYMFIQLIVLFLIFLTALFNSDLMNLFFTNQIPNFGLLKLIIYLAIGIYAVTFIIGYIVNLKLFKKGVNIE